MKALSTSSPSRKKIVLISLAGAILILALAAAYVYLGHGSLFGWSGKQTPSQSQPDLKPATKEQTTAGNTQKTEIVNQDRAAQGKPPIPGTDAPAPSSGTSNNTLAVTVTTANQNGSTVNIRSLIDIITDKGACSLTLTKDSTVVTKTAGIQPLANASTCKGFDIPVSELSAGTWNINLAVTAGSKKGTATGNVVVN